jgi:hypothetical protein
MHGIATILSPGDAVSSNFEQFSITPISPAVVAVVGWEVARRDASGAVGVEVEGVR